MGACRSPLLSMYLPLATMKRPKKVAGDGVIERGSIHKLAAKVWDLNGGPGCTTDDKAAAA